MTTKFQFYEISHSLMKYLIPQAYIYQRVKLTINLLKNFASLET